ncbi:MAG: DUF5666 domain-containing protein [bacterium]
MDDDRHASPRHRPQRTGLALLFAAITACGGGASGGATPVPGDGGTTPPPASGGSAGARLIGSITDSGALGATARNAPASGVRIEVLDGRGRALGAGSSDGGGAITIDGLPAGSVSLRLTLPSSVRPLASGAPPTLTLAATLAANGDAALVEDLGLADLNADGQPDAVVFAGYVRDANGERVHRMALDPASGRTVPDTNGDGQVNGNDAGFDDSNGDGVPDDSQQPVPVTSEVQARGVIEDLGTDAITVGGVTFAITGNTVWLDGTGSATVPSAFQQGDAVEVEGVRQADGGVVATRVKAEDDGGVGQDEVELTGTVENLDSASITVRGVTFAIASDTVVTGQRNQPIGIGDLAVGDFVEIEGETRSGTLTAVRIHVEDLGDDTGGEVELRGTVDAIDGGSITVGGQVFAITGSTQFRDDDGNAISAGDIQVGQRVEIEGTRDPSGNLVATKVKIEDETGGGGGNAGPGNGGDDGSSDDGDGNDDSGSGSDGDSNSGPGGGSDDDGGDDHGGGSDDDGGDDHGGGGSGGADDSGDG